MRYLTMGCVSRVLLPLLLSFVLFGCAGLMQGVRTTIDLAKCLCQIAGEQELPQRFGGLTAEQWCAKVENYQPFLDEIEAAKAAASRKAGFGAGR